jgi:hypothetical protein
MYFAGDRALTGFDRHRRATLALALHRGLDALGRRARHAGSGDDFCLPAPRSRAIAGRGAQAYRDYRCALHHRAFGGALLHARRWERMLGASPAEIDEDFRQAATIAAMAAPYRHSKLTAVKIAGDPNNPLRFKDDATAAELREEIMRRLRTLSEAGVIDLTALPAPKRGIAN